MTDRTVFRLRDIVDAIDQIEIILDDKPSPMSFRTAFFAPVLKDFWKLSAKLPGSFRPK